MNNIGQCLFVCLLTDNIDVRMSAQRGEVDLID